MRTAFISDIHGNARALEAVLNDIEQRDVQQIMVLGDICYRGPEPKKALSLIRSLDVPVLKGNADEWVVRGVREGEVPDATLAMMQDEQAWCRERLSEEDIDYLNQLPTNRTVSLSDNVTAHIFHATPTSLFDMTLPHVEPGTLQQQLMQEKEADVYVYGHIHLPYVRYIFGKTVANTGSVGLPFDGLPEASYLLAEAEGDRYRLTIERVAYDLQAVLDLYEQENYPNAEGMRRVLQHAAPPG